MNLLHGNEFFPWEDFFVNPFGSDVISPNQLCKCMYMYAYRYRCWSKHMQWNNELGTGFAPGKNNCFVNPLLLRFTSPNSILC